MIEFHFPSEQGNGFQPSKPAMQVVESAFLQQYYLGVQVRAYARAIETVADATGDCASECFIARKFLSKIRKPCFLSGASLVLID